MSLGKREGTPWCAYAWQMRVRQLGSANKTFRGVIDFASTATTHSLHHTHVRTHCVYAHATRKHACKHSRPACPHEQKQTYIGLQRATRRHNDGQQCHHSARSRGAPNCCCASHCELQAAPMIHPFVFESSLHEPRKKNLHTRRDVDSGWGTTGGGSG